MFQAGPANNEFLELGRSGITGAYGIISTYAGMNQFPRKVEMMMDVTPLSPASSPATDIVIAGKANGIGPHFRLSNTLATTLVGVATFDSTRLATTIESEAAMTWGERMVLYGVDDAETVEGYVNGENQTTDGEWTAAQGADVITTDTNPFYLGYNGAAVTYLRLHEFWLKVNGVVCVHLRPKILYRGTGAVPDLSGFGNHMTISGTEDANYRFGSSWNEQPAFSGKEMLG